MFAINYTFQIDDWINQCCLGDTFFLIYLLQFFISFFIDLKEVFPSPNSLTLGPTSKLAISINH